ncbi:MAG TPA: helix-turn-helix transcriptional regulator [Desulfotomaculum sp.]|nr:helix-turn-helix transcriptional regulator [Desulfotomaculum sp.]
MGEKIRELRIRAGYETLGELHRASGVTVATLSRIESGVQIPSPKTLNRLAPFLKVSVEDLLAAAGYLPEKEEDPNEAAARTIEAAISDDPELLEFWQELVKRDDLQLLFKQVKPLTPKSIKKIIKVIKAIEDAEATED